MRSRVLIVVIAFAIALLTLQVALAEDVISASQSFDGSMSAVWTKDHQILLVRSDGSILRRIGTHGAAPLFSHDSLLVAYQKLADSAFDDAEQSLFEFAQGIAVYNLRTGQEHLITNGGSDDFAPVGFSRNMSLLYFNSTRPYVDSPGNHVASLWVVELKSGNVKRLTNNSEEQVRRGVTVPIIGANALWFSDRSTVISSIGPESGVWRFVMTADSVSASRIADGDSPRWVIPDRSFAVRTISDGKTVWRTLKVR